MRQLFARHLTGKVEVEYHQVDLNLAGNRQGARRIAGDEDLIACSS